MTLAPTDINVQSLDLTRLTRKDEILNLRALKNWIYMSQPYDSLVFLLLIIAKACGSNEL